MSSIDNGYITKHQIKLKDLYNLQEKIIAAIGFFGCFSFGIYVYMFSTMGGFILLILSILPGGIIFYKNAKKRILKVYRIERNNKVSRFIVEYWKKEDVKNLDQRFFWMVNGKYVPILQFSNKKDRYYQPVFPFDKPDPRVRSGNLQRSLVQKATEILMTPKKDEKYEALKTGGLLILAGGGGILIIAMMGNITGGAT